MRIFLFIGIFILAFASTKANNPVKVGLFYGQTFSKCTFLSQGQTFTAKIGEQSIEIGPNTSVTISVSNGNVNLEKNGKTYSSVSKITLASTKGEFKIQPSGLKANSRIYNHTLLCIAVGSRLQLVNQLDVEEYIPGVIEAEGGGDHHLEYYKVQAVISRTYALNNLRRHEAEGYHICDATHCQVYHGRPRHEPLAKIATDATRDIVIVDSNIDLITAAFHSNCGGHTVNAEDVWSKPLSYCVAKQDTFCLVMPHSNWEKTIPLSQWTDYLEFKRFPLKDSLAADVLAYFPSEKQVYFVDDSLRIPLRVIRTDLKLKSTFFTVHQTGDEVTFIGQGFGHGVGLCQEGAMRMALLGYTYQDIIHFYYTDVHLVPKHLLWFFRGD